MTEYVVFEFHQENPNAPGVWRETAKVGARSATSAIRSALDGDPQAQGQFAAVPARSWKPVTVKVETKTELKFS